MTIDLELIKTLTPNDEGYNISPEQMIVNGLAFPVLWSDNKDLTGEPDLEHWLKLTATLTLEHVHSGDCSYDFFLVNDHSQSIKARTCWMLGCDYRDFEGIE
jgi:hypothetical protein